MQKTELIDMTSQRFGHWFVLKRAQKNQNKKAMWICRCDCGREAVVVGCNLRSGITTRCKSCASREIATTHGYSRTRLHNIWANMKARCKNKRCPTFKHYGGRGISVCKEWMESFEAFRDWALRNGYSEGLEIDRINNDGNYCPENCRWATRKQQNRNTSQNRMITINGTTKNISEWAELSGVNYFTIRWRLRNGISGENLLTKPAPKKAII